MKVVDTLVGYKILKYKSLIDLQNEVLLHCNDGWHLHGFLLIDDLFYYQAVIKWKRDVPKE